MTVSSIILDLRGSSPVITNPNIASMTVDICPTVEVITMDICTWITYQGGWNDIDSYDIIVLADAYLEQSNLGFPITMSYIAGGISYYLKRRVAGNTFTECNFPESV